MTKLKTIFFTFFIAAGYMLLSPSLVLAKDVELNIEKEYFVESAESIRVIEKHTITNNSLNSLIDRSNVDRFQITHLKSNVADLSKSVDSAKVMVEGREVDFDVEYQGESAVLTVKFTRNIGRGDSLTFTLEYQNYGLIEQTGALIDIYASGLALTAVEENEVQDLSFFTRVNIEKGKFPELNFVLPVPSKTVEEGNYYTYEFSKEDLTGRSVWIQLGKKQFYKFKIVQDLTSNGQLPFNNEYRLILPREISNAEIYQKVHYQSILPLPSGIEKDSDGNIFAYFNIPASESGEIVVEGYVEVGVTDTKVNEDNSGVLGDYDLGLVGQWLQPAQYWEVTDPKIVQTATELKGDANNIFDIINRTYDFVVEKIDYSQVKKFGINERLGALDTLNNGSGVCMEYSDLFLTLMRAQGIPAQAVFGFGYDPLIDANAQEPHQWVQVYIPALQKWLDIDVTWGENGEAAVGGYLNHFYTHIASLSPEQHSEVVLTGFAIKDTDLELPGYDITAEAALPEGSFMTQEQLLNQYPYTPKSEVITFLSKIPQNLFNFINSFSDQEKVSIVAFTVGFSLILFPVLYLFRNRIDFGGKKKEPKEEITSPAPL